MLRTSSLLWKSFLNLVFPCNCILCQCHLNDQTQNTFLCPSCLKNIEFNKPPFCQKCSRHLSQVFAGNICPPCSRINYFFDKAAGAVVYNDTMQRLIHLFKYENKTHLRHIFAYLINQFLESAPLKIRTYDCLVPIPLSSARFRERSYNQSELLARLLSKTHGISLSEKNLIRIRHTPNQALLRKKERWTNIQGAFRIKNPLSFKNKSVLLLDDLLTTGATVSEAAKALKENGALSVDVLTLSIA